MSTGFRGAWQSLLCGLALWLVYSLAGAFPLAAQALALEPGALKQIDGGGQQTCVLTAAGAVQCWGSNQDGLLGDGATNNSWVAVDVVGLDRDVQAISVGWPQACAITADGSVQCWGFNVPTPRSVEELGSGVQSIAVGERHACAVTAAGGVKCWGQNFEGQLGDGTKEGRQQPVDVVGLDSPMQAVTAGGDHTCALSTGGSVWCWGSNTIGQLGDGTNRERNGPVAVAGLGSGVQAIVAGSYHTCALLGSGGVKCWGTNYEGQVGDGSFPSRFTPVDVVGLTAGVQQIAAGGNHTCALTADGEVRCWGWNYAGQVGDGSLITRRAPVQVRGLAGGVSAIGAGYSHSCALLADGGAKCWGDNWVGQLGAGATARQMQPQAAPDLGAPVQALAAGDSHTCALVGEEPAGGAVQCWGNNGLGQLGDGGSISRYQAATVSGLQNGVRAITAGRFHTCVLTTGGGVQCWGDNATGQLGDGALEPRQAPVGVVGLGIGVQAISAGRGHTCAVTTGGGVQCWGDNKGGQLGDGTQLASKTPVAVLGLESGVQAVAAGLGLTCALADGAVKCWGAGPVGDGTRNLRTTPVAVTGLGSGVQAITAGDWHVCALLDNGGVKCWGRNNSGQLGDGSRLDRLAPVDVVGLRSGVVQIEAGPESTCAVTVGGAALCWGWSQSSLMNLGDVIFRTAPVRIDGIAGRVQQVTAGGGHMCVLTAGAGVAGSGVQCWGNNYTGELGVNPGWAPLEVLALLPRALYTPLVRQ